MPDRTYNVRTSYHCQSVSSCFHCVVEREIIECFPASEFRVGVDDDLQLKERKTFELLLCTTVCGLKSPVGVVTRCVLCKSTCRITLSDAWSKTSRDWLFKPAHTLSDSVAGHAKLLYNAHITTSESSESGRHEDFRCFTLTHVFNWCSECATNKDCFREWLISNLFFAGP